MILRYVLIYIGTDFELDMWVCMCSVSLHYNVFILHVRVLCNPEGSLPCQTMFGPHIFIVCTLWKMYFLDLYCHIMDKCSWENCVLQDCLWVWLAFMDTACIYAHSQVCKNWFWILHAAASLHLWCLFPPYCFHTAGVPCNAEGSLSCQTVMELWSGEIVWSAQWGS